VTARRPRRPSTFARLSEAIDRYTSGMDPSDLRRFVDRDAPRVYSVLLRERGAEAAGTRGVRRILRIAKLLFLSISEKLSPPRRMIFVLSIVAALAGAADVRFTWAEHSVVLEAGTLFHLIAVAGLLYLLAAELVERVLVRDELQVARQLQEMLLPERVPELPGWRLAATWRTANEIGGDYHHFEALSDGRLAIVVADASGHGMAAGLLMAIADTALRVALENDPAPEAVAAVLHRALRRTGNRRSFLTLFYGRLDGATGRLDYVCAGHPPPLVRRADGTIEEPPAGALPLGLRESCEPVRGELALAPGDLLVLFSDGLFEAIDARGEAFGHDRIRAELAAATGAADLADRLLAALDRHLAGEALPDDLTLVAIARDTDEVTAVR
jgi:serine phosphatase RsbU (regulator of sigma subunit)